ncbi:hypothetical protein ASF32_13660 [Methylobacterium sp. Leaf91]|nr:hypothetical protein ASF32_13660 [Methylobacterium sp. Leaf91]
MDEKSIDGTYRSCIDEVRAAIELLDCTIDGDNGEETEQLDVELVKHILSIILESLGTDTAWSQRIRILIVELNMLLEMWKLVGVQAATFH